MKIQPISKCTSISSQRSITSIQFLSFSKKFLETLLMSDLMECLLNIISTLEFLNVMSCIASSLSTHYELASNIHTGNVPVSANRYPCSNRHIQLQILGNFLCLLMKVFTHKIIAIMKLEVQNSQIMRKACSYKRAPYVKCWLFGSIFQFQLG